MKKLYAVVKSFTNLNGEKCDSYHDFIQGRFMVWREGICSQFTSNLKSAEYIQQINPNSKIVTFNLEQTS